MNKIHTAVMLKLYPQDMPEDEAHRERRIKLNLGVFGEDASVYKECGSCRNIYLKKRFDECLAKPDLLKDICLICDGKYLSPCCGGKIYSKQVSTTTKRTCECGKGQVDYEVKTFNNYCKECGNSI